MTLQSFRYVDRKKELKEQRPTVTAAIKTRVIGRLYMRGAIPPVGQKLNTFPQFQEVFYEWSISVSADRQSVVSLKADYLQENDIFRVEPEGAVTERVPETPLGFKTPDSRKPSHYALIVKTDDLTDMQPLVVTVRRSITQALVDSDLVKLSYLRSPTSKVKQPDYDMNVDVPRLKKQAKIVAEWIYPPSTIPLPIHPPGDVPLGTVQSALEVWCQNEDCTTMTAGNLVAEWNRVGQH